jgi:uncharacterized protein YndB with AHSA1/START domain
MTSTDRIEKTVLLKAPRPKVWEALADSAQFGAWFGANFQGPFEAGQPASGVMTVPGYEGAPLRIYVDRVESPSLFSFRWHPYDPDPNVDTSREPMTLITFELEEVAEGTRLAIVESGFDALPKERAMAAYRTNDEGWKFQTNNIRQHVEGAVAGAR